VGTDVQVRVQGLLNANVDVVTIDTAHGDSLGVINTIKKIKSNWADLPVIAGNVVTAEGVDRLIAAGADVIKVGVGAGSICTTRVITGAGMPQITAIHDCAQVAKKQGVSVIADGGVTYSGDIVKAIAAGADAVMLGGMLAGLEESPGEEVLYEGRLFKEYRGMGSMGVMQGYSRDRYATGQGAGKLVPEGIEGRIPFKGPLKEYIYQLVGGLRSGMGYAGVATLEALRTGARLVRVSGAGLIESHPHDIHITKESPNYQAPTRW
jgi:IMP dehydrogenase